MSALPLETPRKERERYTVGTPTTSPFTNHKLDTLDLNDEINKNTKPFLPSPKTPDETSFDKNTQSPALLISTSLDNVYASPLSSPIELDNRSLASPTSNSHSKYIPQSIVLSKEETLKYLEESVIDPKFKFKVKTNEILGRGSFSTVFRCEASNDKSIVALKIPKTARYSKLIYKEALNFRILSDYLHKHDLDPKEFPILNSYGIVFLNRSDYHRIRLNEVLPCFVSQCLSSNLETFIYKCSPTESNQLHIGDNLWWKLAKELIMGLLIFRDCQLVHMDLKTSNVLFDSETESFKIADFTSAGLLDDVLEEMKIKKESGLFFDLTLQYSAPELVDGSGSSPSFKTDLYSVGLILLAAATGYEPYSEILERRSHSALIQLTECIRKNKVLDVLSSKSLLILQSNPVVFNLIRAILVHRVELDDVLAYLNEH